MNTQTAETTLMESIQKSAPAAASSGLILAGVPLSDWVVLLSGVFICCQLFFLLRDKAYLPWKAAREAAKSLKG
jgi:hypothetical protein